MNDLDASVIPLNERTSGAGRSQSRAKPSCARRANRRIADHLKQAQRIARIGSWEWDRKTNRVVCSEEVFRLLHVDAEQFRPTTASLLQLVHADDRRAFRRWIIRISHGEEPRGIDLRMHAPDGTLVHLHVLGEAFRRLDDRAIGVTGTIQDATERTHAIQQIHRLAYYDVLTELPNRSRFHEKLAETLDTARRSDKAFAIMFLDLDRSAPRTLGHASARSRHHRAALTRVLRVEDPAGARGKSAARRCVMAGTSSSCSKRRRERGAGGARCDRVIETRRSRSRSQRRGVFVSARIAS